LRDDRAQELQVVLLDLIDIACVGYTQTQGRPIELEGYDRLEPLDKLLLGGLVFQMGEAFLPHIIICLRVSGHVKCVVDGLDLFDTAKL
jgi:hypothetical protein